MSINARNTRVWGPCRFDEKPPLMVNVDCRYEWYFQSRPHRPIPLTDTYGSISRRINNTSYGFSYTYPTGTGTETRHGTAFFCFLNVPVTSENEDNTPTMASSTSRALSRFNSGSLDAAQSLAELGKTARTISDNAKAMADIVQAVTQGNIPKLASVIGRNLSKAERRAMNAPKTERVASMWLNLNYNYRQLADDIYNAVKEYHSTIASVGDTIGSSSGRKSKKPNEFGNLPLQPNGLPSPYALQTSRLTKADVFGNGGRIPDAHVSVRSEVTNKAAAELNRLGLLNPMSLAWNLLPFSFVADWCSNIGELLKSMTAGLGFGPLRVCRITETRHSEYSGGAWRSTSQSIWRTGGTASITSITPRMLRIAVKPSLSKATNALALAAQQISRASR